MNLTVSAAAHAHEKLKVLSRQEYEVAKRIAIGMAPAVIAEEMDLSVKTVSTYRARILEKLKLGSNAAIAILAYQAGIIEVDYA